ncbi:small ribosomal subunit protein uS5-like [Peromyscus eremicus]|uniref:small ribosomal subunit protein uS5-like n=1 Tax=Peromyscus eremicus TaxID=42410 RepID=UPI0027DB2184|nr:small ribosomal subunit protein uS5-like [Peromyscus eremicus]
MESLEIYLFSLPIKEHEMTDFFLGASQKDEVMPVQKVTRAGKRTRFKAFVTIGDSGHVGLAVKSSEEVATAIWGVMILAKLSIVLVWRGYWRASLASHCGSLLVHITPGIVSAPVPKKLVMTAAHQQGCTAILGNVAKATFDVISKTDSYLRPHPTLTSGMILCPPNLFNRNLLTIL